MKQGAMFRIGRFGSRIIHPGWKVDVQPPAEPSVYICSHHNMHGPVTALTWLPFPVRPWVLSVFFDYQSCKKQYSEYTFSKRYGMPQWLATFLASAVSGVVAGVVHSACAVPVWRGSSKIHSTFRESGDALCAGDSLLIFPDIAYSAENQGIGEIYEGFLLLGRLYARETGKNLAFIPLYCDENTRHIREGKAIVYNASAPSKDERRRVAGELIAEINEMASRS